MNFNMIHLENISLFYPDFSKKILEDISWDIGGNEKWVLFGPNGSGKTKLLEIIAGYIYPSRGSASRFGQDHGSDIRDVRKRIGYVSTPLKERFYRTEPIIDVVVSGVSATIGLYQDPDSSDIERAGRLLESIGLADKAARPFGILSDGEKQKVLMLRAIMAGPDLMILDEPTMGLDLSAREELLLSLESLCAGRSISIIYVTHYTEEITPFFEKIFMLKNGRCWFCGGIKEGISDNILSGLFGRDIHVISENGRFYAAIG
jgi:iron complex transport system ATP-binding protein